MNSYNGITLAKGYNKSFADFKEEFSSIHIFKNMHPEKREKELEKTYNVLVSSNQKKIESIEVKDAETVKKDGNDIRTDSKSKEVAAKQVAK